MIEAPFEVDLPEAGESVSLSGIWDRVEFGSSENGLTKSARIIEFKSHTSASSTALLKPSAPGAARLQLLLYALAFERMHGAPPEKCALEVVESGSFAELDCDLTPGSTDSKRPLILCQRLLLICAQVNLHQRRTSLDASRARSAQTANMDTAMSFE